MKVLVAGDFCPRCRVQQMLDQQDYSAFETMQPIISRADYSIVNFECPVVIDNSVVPIPKCGPNLKTTPNAIEALRYIGFDCVTLANNHFRDFGDVGCETTLDLLKKAKIDYVGGGRNLSEAQQILYKTLGDKRVAVVNFCENEFSIAGENLAGAAPLDTVDNYNQIKEARENADIVLVIVHGGHEHNQLPSPRMKKLYRHFVSLGADAVINHHQHCYSGYEYFLGKPIIYGLGNFCFDKENVRNSIWNEGYCVIVNLDNLEVELMPYIQGDNLDVFHTMTEQQSAAFFSRVDELNQIISDDKLLKEGFDAWVRRREMDIQVMFAPYANRYLNAAAIRRWIPTRLTYKRAVTMLNYIACEAHRDITISVLQRKIQ